MTDFPQLDIHLVGVNKLGKEADIDIAAEGRDVPLLQDVDLNNDGVSDSWGLWNAEWRDVVILDSNNEQVGTYNLTTYNLAVPENYETLKQMLIAAAEKR